jgi:hypothetical protein
MLGNPVEQALGEVPLPTEITDDDTRYAVRAVVVHAPEAWPVGPLCRNDRAPHPCRLHRWGRRVLDAYGLTSSEIDELVERGDPAARVPERKS